MNNRTGAGAERIADMDLPGMSTYLDWINVMTYDFHGAFFKENFQMYNYIFKLQVVGNRRLVIMLLYLKIIMKQQLMFLHHLLNRNIIVMLLFKVILQLVHLARNWLWV